MLFLHQTLSSYQLLKSGHLVGFDEKVSILVNQIYHVIWGPVMVSLSQTETLLML